MYHYSPLKTIIVKEKDMPEVVPVVIKKETVVKVKEERTMDLEDFLGEEVDLDRGNG